MVKIKMLETRIGSPDGVTIRSYVKGEKYELPDDLALVFVREGWGKSMQVRVRKQSATKKALGAAPENKNL